MLFWHARGPDRTQQDFSALLVAARLDDPTEFMAAHGYAISWTSKGADKDAEWWFDTDHSMGLDVGHCQFFGCYRHRHHGHVSAKIMSNEQEKSITVH